MTPDPSITTDVGAAVTGGAVARSLALFIVAGLLEIGDGDLVWLWLRQGRAVALGALGGLLLFVYGVVPTVCRSSPLRPAGGVTDRQARSLPHP